MSYPTSAHDIESELLKLARTENIESAIVALHIFAQEDGPFRIEIIKPWYRAGAETYVATFEIRAGGGRSKHLVLKACTPSSPATPIEKLLGHWIERRKTLAEVMGREFTPELFGFGGGVLLEEFIPHEITSSELLTIEFTTQFVAVLSRLRILGYDCRPLLRDFRSRGADIVLIDFGEDLGEPSVGIGPDYTGELLDFLQKAGASDEVCLQIRSLAFATVGTSSPN